VTPHPNHCDARHQRHRQSAPLQPGSLDGSFSIDNTTTTNVANEAKVQGQQQQPPSSQARVVEPQTQPHAVVARQQGKQPSSTTANKLQQKQQIDLLDGSFCSGTSCDTTLASTVTNSSSEQRVESDDDDDNHGSNSEAALAEDAHHDNLSTTGSDLMSTAEESSTGTIASSHHEIIFRSCSSDGDAFEVVAAEISSVEYDCDDENCSLTSSVTNPLPTVIEDKAQSVPEETQKEEGAHLFVKNNNATQEQLLTKLFLTESQDEDGVEIAYCNTSSGNKHNASISNYLASPTDVSSALPYKK